MKKLIFLSVLAALLANWMPERANANGIVVTNVRMTNRDTSAGPNDAANHTFVRFNISWKNAWRLRYSTGINNRDAAWVFIKYKVDGTNEWKTAWLNDAGHLPGTWKGDSFASGLIIEPGLQDPSSSFDAVNNPALGVFMYANNFFMGDAGADSLQLRWNYGAQGIPDSVNVELRVFALEMAYVPTVGFWLGTGGTENGSFTDGNWSAGGTIPFRIVSEDAISIADDSAALWGTSTMGDSSIGVAGTLPAVFPKGYDGFYVQKYEITQRQWIDFFNTLTPNQKLARDITDATGKNSDNLTNRNNISWEEDDATLPGELYEGVACNFLSWADVTAYLDWAGLRPMTELEFEKVTRGDRAGFANEFAWGSSFAAATVFGILNPGATNEGIDTSTYLSSGVTGNAAYDSTDTVDGPLRVGIFAANVKSTGRGTAGAARYGAFEMSGNVWERVVNVSTSEGRGFVARHGDGQISVTGQANESSWPDSTGIGSGLRGGGYESSQAEIMISDRSRAAEGNDLRTVTTGGRGVRSRVCNAATSTPTVVDVQASGFENILELTTSGASGDEGYLWISPIDWRIINGQGTNKIFINVGSYPVTLRVVIMNECGAGPERLIELLEPPTEEP